MISRRNFVRWPLGVFFPAALTALVLTGCFESETVQCAETGLICGQGSVCTDDGDGCTETACGNGQMDTGEICDDGNIADGDGCSPSCLSNETCNNGVLDVNLPNSAPETPACRDPLATATNCAEICEDDPDDDNDRCSPNCLSTGVCGNGIVDQYLPVTPNPLTAPAGPCEHSTNVGTDCKESCDDGNQDSGDGCSSNCLSEEDCGNGIVDVGESCDDGQRDGRNDSTGCRNDCSGSAECGNTTVDTGEECDDQGDSVLCDGDSPDAAATGNVCTFRLCGDGYINPSASGTFVIRGKSEVAVAAGLTVRQGSWLHIWEAVQG